ncbi:hypothetical protein AAFX88_003433 [Bacillus cereus]
MKLTPGFIIGTLLVTLIGIPVLFNFVFLLDFGLAKGEMSDWFTFYGNIFGGLIGGFFTYGALLLTFRQKEKEMKPQMDIPHQIIEFIDDDNDTNPFTPIAIELNNIGGSIAKNIECKLSLSNYEEIFGFLRGNQEDLGIELKKDHELDFENIPSNKRKKVTVRIKREGAYKGHLYVYKESMSSFLGSCVPLTLNHEAKATYVIPSNTGIGHWINYIARNKKVYPAAKDVLFEFELEVKYSSPEGEDLYDRFKLKWELKGKSFEDTETKHWYILRSEKETK